MEMFTQDTPNPHSLKFIPDYNGDYVEILPEGTMAMDFPHPDTASASPLVQALFDVDGVTSIFLGDRFVTVTKDESVEWHHLRPAIEGAISDYLTAGLPILVTSGDQAPINGATAAHDYKGETREVVEQIIELIDTRIRPAVAQDGGDIVFHKYDEDDLIVYLSMRGACAGCPSSTLTLKSGIENLLKHYLPEDVNSVEAIG